MLGMCACLLACWLCAVQFLCIQHIVVYMPSTNFGIGIFSVKLFEQFNNNNNNTGTHCSTAAVSQLSHIATATAAAAQPLCVVVWCVTTEPTICSTTNQFYLLDFSQQCATNESTSRTVSQSQSYNFSKQFFAEAIILIQSNLFVRFKFICSQFICRFYFCVCECISENVCECVTKSVFLFLF